MLSSENGRENAEILKQANKDINKINRQLKSLFKLWKAGIINAKVYYEKREEQLSKRRMIYDMHGI